MKRTPLLAAGFALAAATSAWGQTVTPAQPPGGGTAGQSVVTPPVESIVPGNAGPSGAANVVLPPAESLTRGPNQTVLPPVEQLVPGAPGGFPATTGAADTGTATGAGSTATGTLGVNTAAGLTVPPALSAAQAAQGALQQGGLAPIVTETGITATRQVAFFGDPESAQRQPRRAAGAEAGAMQGVPIGTSPGSRPGAPQYIGTEVTPYDPDMPDALDFSRTP